GSSAADLAPLVPSLPERLHGAAMSPALDSAEARFRLFDAVARFVELLARRAPVVLVIDDLHGADPSSLLLLQFLIHQVRTLPLLMAVTYRDAGLPPSHPLNATLAEALREPGTERIALRGLSETEVAEFVELAGGVRPAPALVATLHRRTDG